MQKGPRYLEMTDGYVYRFLHLTKNDEIIGYKFVKLRQDVDPSSRLADDA